MSKSISMHKELILQKLKEQGCRITKQRLIILDIILENDATCCKDIYYRASKLDDGIGLATVYRFMNTLEEIGAIDRTNQYKITYSDHCHMDNVCIIRLEDETYVELSAKHWNAVVKAGLEAKGYMKDKNIESITVHQCACSK